MRHPHDEIARLQRGDNPGHGRRLHLFVLGQLARAHRRVPLQRRQRGQLGVGQGVLDRSLRYPLHAQPTGQPAHRNPECRGEAGVRPALRCNRHVF